MAVERIKKCSMRIEAINLPFGAPEKLDRPTRIATIHIFPGIYLPKRDKKNNLTAWATGIMVPRSIRILRHINAWQYR